MLILSRKLNQRIIIDKKIAVTILGIEGNQVRVGIIAPAEVSVHREEVYHKMHGKMFEAILAVGSSSIS